ncbi:MAG: TerC family protein [Pseudomonadales bacterium]|jgi:predicted tellurium resistance membrane protein TerC|nr:TerC family protein [Pseudomonadales bacterium]
MFDWIASPEAWIALSTLVALEIVLGIDNIIFISILVSRQPPEKRELARRLGIGFALITRLGLLFSLSWLSRLTAPLFTVLTEEISGRDLVLILGGLFLLAKSTKEIHTSLETDEHTGEGVASAKVMESLLGTVIQIGIIDIVFSLDSVITAVGLVQELAIMSIAIIIAVCVMLLAARTIGEFIDQHPTLKMLALAFLMMIGLTLIVEGFDVHVPKAYIYFAMAFSVFVEMLNLKLRKKLRH